MTDPRRLPDRLQSPPRTTPESDPVKIKDAPYGLVPTGCQYCVVGCGYEAHLWERQPPETPGSGSDERPEPEQAHWVSPAMTGTVHYEGSVKVAAVVPDPKCPMNKGNHSPRGGTQGRNLVASEAVSEEEADSTRERIKTAYVRTEKGFEPIAVDTALDVLGELVKVATGWKNTRGTIHFATPSGLGVKLYEYQYLENTFAATRLFFQLIGTPNVAFHDRPSVASNTQGFDDSGIDPHGYAYDDIWNSDVLLLAGNNPYESQSVFFMQYMAGKKLIVLDPRRTITADYAEKTGGLHLQPQVLGADVLVLNALARYIQLKQQADPVRWPDRMPRELIVTEEDLNNAKSQAANSPPEEGPTKPRQARYRLNAGQFATFLAEQFQGEADPDKVLQQAAGVSGIPVAHLALAAQLLAGPAEGAAADLPPIVATEAGGRSRHVSLIFEKGLIWGYSYQNTAAMANLGLLLGSVLRPGEEDLKQLGHGVTGRAGGHQKGWAEVRYTIGRTVETGDPTRREYRCFTAGYPFYNATDEFAPESGAGFRTHNSFDTHLVGTDVAPRHPRSRGPADPDIRLLWIVGSNAIGQVGNAQAKAAEIHRRRGIDQEGALPASASKTAVLKALKQRIQKGGLVVVQQDIYPNPTTEFADLVLPAAGWGEHDFTRYTGERRLRLYGRFQDPPAYRDPKTGQIETDANGNPVSRCLPDWRIFQAVAQHLLPDEARGHGLPTGFHGVELGAADFSWATSAELFRDMARSSNRFGLLGAIEAGTNADPQGHSRLRARGSRGYVVPLTSEGGQLKEHPRTKVPNGRPYAFVRADWKEIEADFQANRANTAAGEFFLCNGRINELWNSLFTHIRNETVRQRWPDDMPGTLLEMHPDDAATLGITNGSLVKIQCPNIHLGKSGQMIAVVSLQPRTLPRGMVFALFSYPAMTREADQPQRMDEFPYRKFTTDAYVNNVTTGYVDPINPIAAVKYARATITPLSTTYVPGAGYLGPSYALRNVAFATERLPPTATRQQRLDWQMRELIVQKGLVRARVHSGSKRQESFRDPDALLGSLKSGLASTFGAFLDSMEWQGPDGLLDNWDDPYLAFARHWIETQGTAPPPLPKSPEAAMRSLLAAKRDAAQETHGFVPVPPDTTLQALFQTGTGPAFDRILTFLREGKWSGRRLIVPRNPEGSEFYRLVTVGAMAGFFRPEERKVVKQWIMSLPADAEPPPTTDPREAMLGLLRARRDIARLVHDEIPAGAGTLNDLFAAEQYDNILHHLEQSRATRAPYANRPLIVPQKPEESGFFLHISQPDGAMVGRFGPTEIEVVRRWILSLATAPPLPSSPTRLTLVRIATGLTKPLFATAPPGDTQRLFLVEQGGVVKIFNLQTGTLSSQPFLTVGNLSTGGERGLLGLAFHPNYATNGLFYINCTDAAGNTNIRRYKVSNNPDVADAGSEQRVLRIAQPFSNHNGGWIGFGPRDGFLYIATGDGGSFNDPGNRAQNRNLLLGKMLRIDVNGDDFPGDATRNYAIPPSNPFVGQTGTQPEIWAYGLRNPWRCSFDRATGDLYLGDVGQDEREEIDFQAASSPGGENYGWRLKEGTRPTGLDPIGTQQLVDPIHEYGRSDGFSVIGGPVYRGTAMPGLRGIYLFADFGGRVWSFRYQNGTKTEFTDRTAELSAGGTPLRSLASFGEDAAGEVYLVSLEGDVFRMSAVAVEGGQTTPATTKQYRIHPAIGIARIGNSPEFFLGPETPGEVPNEGEDYRDGQKRIKKQAQRFRIYEYESTPTGLQAVREITTTQADVASITWQVQLTNRKGALRSTFGPAQPRNTNISDLTSLIIDSAKQDVSASQTQASPRPLAGRFLNTPVELGKAWQEATGRLVVVGGHGQSAGPPPSPGDDLDFANNNGWYDDTSDGVITATIVFRNGPRREVDDEARLIVAPPRYAPALPNFVTLYDVAWNAAWSSNSALWPNERMPSFHRDILPIIQRSVMLKWVSQRVDTGHGAGKPGDFLSPAQQALLADPNPDVTSAAFRRRRRVFGRLRVPPGSAPPQPVSGEPPLPGAAQRNMPEINNSFTLTPLQYEWLRKWSLGQFTTEALPSQTPVDQLPVPDQPAALDRAILEQGTGGPWFPGIETWFVFGQPETYRGLLRVRADLPPGHLTIGSALPWQADFNACGTRWWPSHRPNEVSRRVNGQIQQFQVWVPENWSNHDMVARWNLLGFVVADGELFLETERNV